MVVTICFTLLVSFLSALAMGSPDNGEKSEKLAIVVFIIFTGMLPILILVAIIDMINWLFVINGGISLL